MTVQEFAREINRKSRELSDLIQRKMPVLVGRMAKDHYQDNFRKGGEVNGGLKKWTPAKRLSSGSSSAGANYGTLLSGRNHLFSSVSYTPGAARVRVHNYAPHASTHNDGGTVEPTVTPKMRRFAWAKYYEAGGGKKNAGNGKRKGKNAGSGGENKEAEFWKNFALTKKKKLSIKMPVRRFLGESKELNKEILDKQEAEIRKIINS